MEENLKKEQAKEENVVLGKNKKIIVIGPMTKDDNSSSKLIEAQFDNNCYEKSYDDGITQYEYKYIYNKKEKKSIMIPVIQMSGFRNKIICVYFCLLSWK